MSPTLNLPLTPPSAPTPPSSSQPAIHPRQLTTSPWAAPQPAPALLLGRRVSPARSQPGPYLPSRGLPGRLLRRVGSRFTPPQACCRLSLPGARQRLAPGKRCAPPRPSCAVPKGRGRWERRGTMGWAPGLPFLGLAARPGLRIPGLNLPSRPGATRAARQVVHKYFLCSSFF